MKANASKHKAMSYDRMQKDEVRLKAEVEALIQRAEQTDAAEDAQYGVGKQPEDLPAEICATHNLLKLWRALRPSSERQLAAPV